jgi:hypothetical protein
VGSGTVVLRKKPCATQAKQVWLAAWYAWPDGHEVQLAAVVEQLAQLEWQRSQVGTGVEARLANQPAWVQGEQVLLAGYRCEPDGQVRQEVLATEHVAQLGSHGSQVGTVLLRLR